LTDCSVHSQPLPSVDEWRQSIKANNDGTQPAEPAQRCSQILFETWLKEICLEQKLVDGYFGLKFVSSTEDSEGVTSHLVDHDGRAHVVRSKYLIGADGGGSSVRKSAGINMIGGPLYVYGSTCHSTGLNIVCSPFIFYLVHFRSKELAERRPFGRFWHTFFPHGGHIVDQDELDTFTSHTLIGNMHTDVTKIDPAESVYENLGGSVGPYRFKIDEILVNSAWRPNFSIAEKYASDGGRVILVGDSGKRFFSQWHRCYRLEI
jgi:FAD-dependent monooxygenase